MTKGLKWRLDKLRYRWNVLTGKSRVRLWKYFAKNVDPYLKKGIHIDGITIESDEGVSLTGLDIYGDGKSAGIIIENNER